MWSAWGGLTLPDSASLPAPGVCHLWPVPVGSLTGGFLTEAERLRTERFGAEHARQTFITSRTAQRVLLARYLGVHPEAVAIDRTCARCEEQHGRPTIPDATFDFSVTHTRTWVVLAVVSGGRVGVDLEHQDATRDVDLLGGTLTPAERLEFAGIAAADRTSWFLRRWTRKEAATKLTGHGLNTPFDALDVGGPTVAWQGPAGDWPAEPVHLLDVDAADGLVAAVATTRPVTSVLMCGPVEYPLFR
ncbi:MAG: 4'-phosphopantetheinyl transferase superfamily protein [Hamadaea sp.]|nr:4'-phosphopantetheinyl transferase superfamily protein [Hamadaea sp.]